MFYLVKYSFESLVRTFFEVIHAHVKSGSQRFIPCGIATLLILSREGRRLQLNLRTTAGSTKAVPVLRYKPKKD